MVVTKQDTGIVVHCNLHFYGGRGGTTAAAVAAADTKTG